MAPQQNVARARLRAGAALILALPGLMLRSLGRLFKNRGDARAAVLAYYTLLGLVPIVLALLLTFQWFPSYHDIGQQMLDGIYEHLQLTDLRVRVVDVNSPSEELLTDTFNRGVRAGFVGFNRKLVMIVALVLSLLAAWGILCTTERGLNHIWHVTGPRDLILRLVNYWVLLTLGPLLLALDLYLLTHYQASGLLGSHAACEPYILLFASTVLGLFVLYYVLPKAQVQTGSSLGAALIATCLLGLLAYSGRYYMHVIIPHQHVHGLMGLIPFTVLLVFVAWLIVLYGAQLTYALQHLADRPAVYTRGGHKPFMANDLTVINLLREVIRLYEHDPQPVPSTQLLGRLAIPECVGERVLNYLVDAGYLIHASEPTNGFIPAKDAKDIRLTDLSAIVAQASFGQQGPLHSSLDHVLDEKQLTESKAKLGDLLDASPPSESEPEEENDPDDDHPRLWPER